MVKIQKTFRLSEMSLMDLSEVKEIFARKGLQLSDAQIIEYAIEKLWMEKGLENIDILKRRTK